MCPGTCKPGDPGWVHHPGTAASALAMTLKYAKAGYGTLHQDWSLPCFLTSHPTTHPPLFLPEGSIPVFILPGSLPGLCTPTTPTAPPSPVTPISRRPQSLDAPKDRSRAFPCPVSPRETTEQGKGTSFHVGPQASLVCQALISGAQRCGSDMALEQ